MEDLERIKDRLDNIKVLAPTLTALRNIAAGSWRLARSRLEAARVFSDELSDVLSVLQDELPRTAEPDTTRHTGKIGVLVVASERGLCGTFNTTVLEKAERHIADEQAKGLQVDILTLGTKAANFFSARNRPPTQAQSLPVTTVPSLAMVERLHRELAETYAKDRYERIDLIYTPYQMRTMPVPVVRQLLPNRSMPSTEKTDRWSKPIIDTDPRKLYEQVKTQWVLVEFYRHIMESTASEQAARYAVLDGASTNCDRLITDLTLSYHAARQHAINMEILDLVSGSGLLKSTREQND